MFPKWLERALFPDPPETFYFEKCSAGIILRSQIDVVNGVATVSGDEDGIARKFVWRHESLPKAIEYLNLLGYVYADDWQLPPPAK
jgi:hypothetical protein